MHSIITMNCPLYLSITPKSGRHTLPEHPTSFCPFKTSNWVSLKASFRVSSISDSSSRPLTSYRLSLIHLAYSMIDLISWEMFSSASPIRAFRSNITSSTDSPTKALRYGRVSSHATLIPLITSSVTPYPTPPLIQEMRDYFLYPVVGESV